MTILISNRKEQPEANVISAKQKFIIRRRLTAPKHEVGPGAGLGETHGTRGSRDPRCAPANTLPARGPPVQVVTPSLQATHRCQAPAENVFGLSPPTLLRFSFSDIHRMITGVREGVI